MISAQLWIRDNTTGSPTLKDKGDLWNSSMRWDLVHAEGCKFVQWVEHCIFKDGTLIYIQNTENMNVLAVRNGTVVEEALVENDRAQIWQKGKDQGRWREVEVRKRRKWTPTRDQPVPEITTRIKQHTGSGLPYFPITHPLSQKVLTTTSQDSLAIEGKRIKLTPSM